MSLAGTAPSEIRFVCWNSFADAGRALDPHSPALVNETTRTAPQEDLSVLTFMAFSWVLATGFGRRSGRTRRERLLFAGEPPPRRIILKHRTEREGVASVGRAGDRAYPAAFFAD